MNKARMFTIGGTFICAIGIGFFMQNAATERSNGTTSAEPVARADYKPLSQPALEGAFEAAATSAGSRLDQTQTIPVDLTPPQADALAPTVSVADLGGDGAAAATVAEADMVEQCDVSARALADAGAMIRFLVSAPCHVNERAVVHHNGLMFTAVTDETGSVDVGVPALAEQAVVIIEFENGEGAVAVTEIASLKYYDRIVLQWMGAEAGLQLHAREYGADYGEEGHVWSGAARDVSFAALGEGGFVTRLGAVDTLSPRLAEVYTFPSGTALRSGDVVLSIEAEVTQANCGSDVEAQSLDLRAQGELRTQYLTMAVPGCDAVGGFLVLNNLVDDLKIAAN